MSLENWDRALSSLMITLHRGGSQVLEKDIPGLREPDLPVWEDQAVGVCPGQDSSVV